MSDKEFDEMFREKFGSFEVEPSPETWSRIAKQLNKKKKNATYSWVWTAAGIALFITAGLWWVRPEKTIKLRGQKTALEQVAKVAPSPVRSVATTEGAVKPEQELITASGAGDKKRNRVILAKVETPGSRSEPSEERPTPSPAEMSARGTYTPVETEHPGRVSIPTVVAMLNNEEPGKKLSLATANVMKNISDENSPEGYGQKPAIRSVGDIVNFVVSKVDHRKDKIIEFSDDDEGSLISGINLGLVKIKTRANKEKQNQN